MDSQTALLINQWIDILHNPTYWIVFWFIALYILLEPKIFPKRDIIPQNKYAKTIICTKLFILIFTFSIALSQSLFGGCLITLIQNYIASTYLGREYWYPFGLVFRENFSPEYWIYLRLFYIVITILYGYWVYKYYKFIMKS
ncbi:MAG: hypothetical protein ACO3TG_03960 [Minisyncoccia bacterium]